MIPKRNNIPSFFRPPSLKDIMRPVGDFDLIIAQRRTSVLGPPLLRNMRHSWRESERVYENMYRKFKKNLRFKKIYLSLCSQKQWWVRITVSTRDSQSRNRSSILLPTTKSRSVSLIGFFGLDNGVMSDFLGALSSFGA